MPSHDDETRPERPATEVLLLVAAGKTNEAARLLMAHYTGRIHGRFSRNSLHPWADEMTSDTFQKFLAIKDPLAVADHAEPFLYRIAKNVLLDYARRKNALSRGGGSKEGSAEVSLDDEELIEALANADEPSEDPHWHKALTDCIHKALAFLRTKMPSLAEALWLKYRDYTPEEVAIYYGADPAKLTPRIVANARQRVSDACKKARPYFEHCKD